MLLSRTSVFFEIFKGRHSQRQCDANCCCCVVITVEKWGCGRYRVFQESHQVFSFLDLMFAHLQKGFAKKGFPLWWQNKSIFSTFSRSWLLWKASTVVFVVYFVSARLKCSVAIQSSPTILQPAFWLDRKQVVKPCTVGPSYHLFTQNLSVLKLSSEYSIWLHDNRCWTILGESTQINKYTNKCFLLKRNKL